MKKLSLYKKLSTPELLEAFISECSEGAPKLAQLEKGSSQEGYGLDASVIVDSIYACEELVKGLRKSKIGPYVIMDGQVKANKFAYFLMPPPDPNPLIDLRSLKGILPPCAEFYLHCLEETGTKYLDFRSVGDGDGVKFAEKVNKFYGYAKTLLESVHSHRMFLTASDIAKENYQRSSSWVEREVKRMGSVMVFGGDLWLPGRLLDQQRFVLTDATKRIDFFQDAIDGLVGIVMIPQFHCHYGLGWHAYFLTDQSERKYSLPYRYITEVWGRITGGSNRVLLSEYHSNTFKCLGNVSISGADGFYSFFSSLAYQAKLGEYFPTGLKPVIKSFRSVRGNYYNREGGLL